METASLQTAVDTHRETLNRVARTLAAAAAAVALQVGCVTVTLASTSAINAHMAAADCRSEAALAQISDTYCNGR